MTTNLLDPDRYELELSRSAALLQSVLPIGQIKAIGLLEVHAAIEELIRERSWIRITDDPATLSPIGQLVWLWCENYPHIWMGARTDRRPWMVNVELPVWDGKQWTATLNHFNQLTPTHWHPLPSAPTPEAEP